MPNYIDLDDPFVQSHLCKQCFCKSRDMGLGNLIDFIRSDIQEMKYGHWVHYGEDIQCSNCGHVSDDICYEGDMDSGYYTVLPHYCSNCGCKMLEDE